MEKFEKSMELLSLWKRSSIECKSCFCDEILEIVQERRLSIEEVAELSVGLASSGSIWKWDEDAQPTLDICSTGGAGSLTTLLCPFLVATQGIFAPQVSVPGSIAGAIDTLAMIPNYNVELSFKGMKFALQESSVGNTINTEDLAPADLFLFERRILDNAKDVPDLVIASILSKKICSGVKNTIVDVRVSSRGNFGLSAKEAETNCDKLLKVGRRLGINCTCILTNHGISPMPHYGRLESLAVLWTMANGEVLDPWTHEHVDTCFKIAAYGVSRIKKEDYDGTIKTLEDSVHHGNLRKTLIRNIESQNGSVQNLQKLLKELKKQGRVLVQSPSTGYIRNIDYDKLHDVFSMAYKKDTYSRIVDSPLGLVLKVREGESVRKGDIMCEVRVPPEGLSKYERYLSEMFVIDGSPSRFSNERIIKVMNVD